MVTMAYPRHALEYIPPEPTTKRPAYHNHVEYRCLCGRFVGACSCDNDLENPKTVITFDDCQCKDSKKRGRN